jgi:hypothetical protein
VELLERLARRADVGVGAVVVGEVGALICPVAAARLVEDRDVRLDPAFLDQPAQHRRGAIGAVGDQPLGVEAEAVHRAIDHGARGADLRLPDGARRLDVDDDRVVGVDQIVGRIGEEGVTLLGARPLRRGINGRGELRLHRARRAEGGVVENREILPDRARRRVGIDRRRVPVLAGGRALLVGVRLDQAGIDAEPPAADEPLLDTPAYRRLEDVAEQVAIAEPSVPVLGEGRVVRDPIRQVQAAEPAIGEIEVNLLAQPPLRADPEAVADESIRIMSSGSTDGRPMEL